MKEIFIVDYGLCNLDSVKRSFEECGANVRVTNDPLDLSNADKIVLPGVGNFGEAIIKIKEAKWNEAIITAVIDKKVPILGICLGMQLFATTGTEGKNAEGLNLIPGEIKRLERKNNSERIPHIGWNEVDYAKESVLFSGIDDHKDFYFVHSYHYIPKNADDIVATTPYCGNFVSAIQSKHIFGVQFHPEKSQRYGHTMIKNFIRY